MIEIKTITAEAIPSALELAKRYRLLNEPHEAESICLDILEVEPEHQEALIVMLLALSDNFSNELNPYFSQAQELIKKLSSRYCKDYYSGIIFERRAKVHLKKGGPGSGHLAYDWFSKALKAYGKAMKTCSADNQDAVLRWNSCARIINNHPGVKAGESGSGEMLLDSFETPH